MVGFLKVYGYEDPKAPTGYNIATGPQQLISSFLNIGTIIGVILTATWGKYFGRKPAIWFATIISFVAAGLQVGTTNLTGLYFGRILIGVSNGFYITFANVYTAEASPAHLRGAIVSFFGIWVSIGSILGAIANNFSQTLKSKLSYQIPLACFFAIPTFLSIVVFFVPESPRWLLIHNRHEEARRALEQLRGKSFAGQPELLEEEFQEMKRGIEDEKELSSSSSVKDMFRGPDLRRTILCYSVILSHSSSGVWLVIGYGVRLSALRIVALANEFGKDVLFPNGRSQQALPSNDSQERLRLSRSHLRHHSVPEVPGSTTNDVNRTQYPGPLHVRDGRCVHRRSSFRGGWQGRSRVCSPIPRLLQRVLRCYQLANCVGTGELEASCSDYRHRHRN